MDIRTMIIELESLGYTLKEIADQTNNHAPSLCQIKTGKRQELYYAAGKRLESFYNSVINSNKAA